LQRFFSNRVAHPSDAQELVQDTLLSCLSSLPLFRGEANFWGYMLSVARHELADYWRKKYAKRAISLLPFGQELLDSVERPVKGGNQEDEIVRLLERLPSDISELLQLKYIDGLSIKELATQYGLSFSAMQSRLYRAKEVFKAECEREEIGI
jgi:RNA polymerase sigma-70 factor (ECF subfamily)